MRTLLGIGLVFGLACGVAVADEKIDATKLVGKWEPKETKKEGKMTIEFTKDGKVSMNFSGGGKDFKADGTYKVDGNKLSMTLKFGDKENTMTRTITKLTDTELTSKGEKEDKEDTLVRVKEKSDK